MGCIFHRSTVQSWGHRASPTADAGGISIHTRGKLDGPAITAARSEGMIRFLLENRADLNVPDFYGDTAASHALYDGFPDTLRLLLELKADPNVVSFQDS